jgi:hypothetical protein
MADRDMTCPLDGMFSTRNAGELVAHEPAKTTFVRSGMAELHRSPRSRGFAGLGEGAASDGKILGMPIWAAVAVAAVGAYCLAKR